MRKIRLSDTDIEFFDLEVSPAEFVFFQKHKDAFRCMWKEQGKPFWTKFSITFRSFTVKHGVIKQMSCDSPKFENLVDQAFIYIHEQFVDGKESAAKGFIEDCARLAQNHDKFPHLDSKSFSKDPFYSKDTRDLFRRFFGSPDQKSSYVKHFDPPKPLTQTFFDKVYVLSPIYLRFSGSICRCLKRWMDAPPQDSNDESYWIPPSPQHTVQVKTISKVLMCTKCLDDCGTLYSREKKFGEKYGPKFMDYWKLGNPRVVDEKNPLYDTTFDGDDDWREDLCVEEFRDFVHYAKFKYGMEKDRCTDCLALDNNKESVLNGLKCPSGDIVVEKKKKKKKSKNNVTDEQKENDIQKLVDHITGKCTLEVMPTTTKGGVEARDGTSEGKDMENKSKRKIFSRKAKITDDFKYGILSTSEEMSSGNVVGGFKVVKMEDERTGAKEISITVTSLKSSGSGEEKKNDCIEKKDFQKSKIKNVLTADVIRSKIDNLPEKMEWFEGIGWCASVLNYEEEEKYAKRHTNFTLKVSGRDEDSMKLTMFKLLFYVGKRKKRTCPGWTMDDDDVVACILPDESPDQEGLVICIQKGFSVEEGLTEEERKTMVKPSDIPERVQILMALDGGVAEAATKGPDGSMKLTQLLSRLTGRCIKDKENVEYDGDLENSSMWKQITTEPRTFEMLLLVNQTREEELKALGLRLVDLDLVYASNKKKGKDGPLQKICRTCDKEVYDCICFDKSIYDELLKCNCRKCEYDKLKEERNAQNPEPECTKAPEVSEPEQKEKLDVTSAPQMGKVTKSRKIVPKRDIDNVYKFNTKSPQKDEIKDTQVTVHKGPPAQTGGPPDLLKMASASFSLTFNNEDGTPIEDPEAALEEALHELSDRLDAEAQQKKEAEAAGKTLQTVSTKQSRASAKKAKKISRAINTATADYCEHQVIKADNIARLSKHMGMNETSIGHIQGTRPLEIIQDEQINKQDLGAAKIAMMGGIGRPVTENETGKGRLKCCTTCGKCEPSPKTFKKCQKCKQEGITNARYYCGRECQVMDWNSRHRLEHKENKLEKEKLEKEKLEKAEVKDIE